MGDSTVEQPPRALRAHGVGGPQGDRMLGVRDRLDTTPVPPFTAPEEGSVPADGQTQFLRRYKDASDEAYEWGGLNVGSWSKGLWVLYLPFTLINAGGWAHRRAWAGDGKVPDSGAPGDDRPADVVAHHWLTYVAAVLATVTYVLWIGYLTLALVAVWWHDEVMRDRGFRGHGLVDEGAPIAAFLVVLVLLWVASTRFGQLEQSGRQSTDAWLVIPSLNSWKFFARGLRYGNRRNLHTAVGLLVAAFAVAQYVMDRDRLGLAIVVVAGVQVLVGILLAAVEAVGRALHPYDGTGAAWRPAFLRRLVPVGATFVLVGSALAHSAFAGFGMLTKSMLWDGPMRDESGDLVEVRAELGSADAFGWFLVLLAVMSLVIVVVLWRSNPEGEQGLVVKLARRVHVLTGTVLVALLVPVVGYGVANFADVRGHADVFRWYDTYDFEPNAPMQWAGAWVLTAMPAVVYVALRGAHDTGPARVVGNIWDVLTFWPRRFHPLAAPCTAERAVPELRARIRYLTEAEGSHLTVVAHSQGSVLACAAVGSLEAVQPGRLAVVTFGSPLGTLYAPTWPAYIPPMLAVVGIKTGSWVSFWRATDPIGGPVPGSDPDHRLEDPRDPAPAEYDEDRPILERPPRAGAVCGHSHYLTDPRVRAASGAGSASCPEAAAAAAGR